MSDTTLTKEEQLLQALAWCLCYGVKAVDYSITGYWRSAGPDGSEIMPPAALHVVLDQARTEAINKQMAQAARNKS